MQQGNDVCANQVLAKKMTVLYKLAKEQLSSQHHYDFGLRALKSVLVMAGSLKRSSPDMSEALVLMRALRDMNLPKFVYDDVPLFLGLINDLFPGENSSSTSQLLQMPCANACVSLLVLGSDVPKHSIIVCLLTSLEDGAVHKCCSLLLFAHLIWLHMSCNCTNHAAAKVGRCWGISKLHLFLQLHAALCTTKKRTLLIHMPLQAWTVLVSATLN